VSLIDYFTTAAQIVNFLVLVLLLKHFLYRPVLRSMDEREMKIASRLEEAEKKLAEAEQRAQSIKKIEQDLEESRGRMLAKAEEEAQAYKKDLAEKARKEVEMSGAGWRKSLEHQKEELLADMRRSVSDEVYIVARKAIKDLADDELEVRIIQTFIKRLQRMDEQELRAFKELLKSPKRRVVVRSAFEIPMEGRQRIHEALQERFGVEMDLRFETDPKLISGIELSANEIRISWSVSGYLDDLEGKMSRVLENRKV